MTTQELLSEFLHALTYGGLHDSVSLVNHPKIALFILQNDPSHEIGYLEYIQPSHYIWWTKLSWMRELMRREEFNGREKEIAARRTSPQYRITELQKKLSENMLDMSQKEIDELVTELTTLMHEQQITTKGQNIC